VPRLEDDGEAPIAAALAVVDAVLQRGGVVRAAVAAGRARRVAGRRGQRGGQRARKSGYCPRSTRPPAALARAPVDDAESESESRSRSCCGARQSFAIARTGSLLAPATVRPRPSSELGSRRGKFPESMTDAASIQLIMTHPAFVHCPCSILLRLCHIESIEDGHP
jgi:hypothetical protein